jgi:ubiquinone/menaquinone biosynthesis C-methylase UbiE
MGIENLSACILCDSPDLSWPDREFHVCRCRACGLTFENPRPEAADIAAFYSRPTQYDGWIKDSESRDRLWKRRLAKMAPRIRPGSLLDIGTGIGQFLHHAKGRFTRVTGTEVSGTAIAIAREKYGLDVMQGQVESLDFGDARFDNVTLFHLLEHVGSPRGVLEKCRTLLNPSGVIFIAVPNDIESVGAVMRRFQDRFQGGAVRSRSKVGLPKITLDGTLDEIHLSHFTQDVITRSLAAAGFEVLERSLDPFYVADGLRLAMMEFHYRTFSVLHAVSGINVYGTIWICARKA